MKDPNEKRNADAASNDAFIGAGPDGVKRIQEELVGLRTSTAAAPAVLTDAEIKRRAAVASFKAHSDAPQVKERSWARNPFVLWGTALAAIAAIGLGGKAIVDNTINKPPAISSTYDNGTEINYIKAGVNGQAATPDQVQEFLARIPPALNPSAEGDKNPPRIEIMLPSAGSITVINPVIYPIGFDMKDKDIPFSISVIEGAKTVEAKTECTSPGIIRIVDLRYNLNDGQTIKGYVTFSDNNFIPTAALNDIPQYPPDVLRATQWTSSEYKTFDLSQNPDNVLSFTSGPSSIVFSMGKDTSTGQIGIASTIATALNGKALYPTSTK